MELLANLVSSTSLWRHSVKIARLSKYIFHIAKTHIVSTVVAQKIHPPICHGIVKGKSTERATRFKFIVDLFLQEIHFYIFFYSTHLFQYDKTLTYSVSLDNDNWWVADNDQMSWPLHCRLHSLLHLWPQPLVQPCPPLLAKQQQH